MIIGLTGKLMSGKDTVYGFIQEWAKKNGREAERDAFADRLKLSAGRALGYKEDEIQWMNDLKQDGSKIIIQIPEQHGYYYTHEITGREYLQYYGTEAHRDVFDTDFWVDAVLPFSGVKYNGRDPYDILVITDVRFPNEAKRIRECGGEVWQIIREGTGEDGHASERPLDPELVDTLIVNTDTLETLRDMTFDMCDLQIAKVASV